MSTPANSSPIQLPALPNSGTPPGAAKGWAPVGTDGVARLEIALPISPGRGYAPALALTYRSNAGNSAFGFGWDVNVAAVTRCTRRAVPSYTEADTLLGPDAQAWMPECDANGTPVQTQRDTFNQQALGTTYTVTRHFPRVESDFARIEHWHSALDPAGFWRVQASDGTQHLYGKTSRRALPTLNTPRMWRNGCWRKASMRTANISAIAIRPKPIPVHSPVTAEPSAICTVCITATSTLGKSHAVPVQDRRPLAPSLALSSGIRLWAAQRRLRPGAYLCADH